jgi:hypothetical protein
MQQRPEERWPVISSMRRNKNQTIRQVWNMPWPGEDLLQRAEATNSWRTPAVGETGEKKGPVPSPRLLQFRLPRKIKLIQRDRSWETSDEPNTSWWSYGRRATARPIAIEEIDPRASYLDVADTQGGQGGRGGQRSRRSMRATSMGIFCLGLDGDQVYSISPILHPDRAFCRSPHHSLPWLRRPPARRPALYCLLLRRLTWLERASSGLELVGEEGIKEISTSSIVTICERRRRRCWPPEKPLGRESRAPASTTPSGSRCRWAPRPLQRWLASTYVARGSEMGTNWLRRGGETSMRLCGSEMGTT